MNFGFDKRYRLLKTGDFSSVFALRCQKRRFWVQVFRAENGLSHPRLGLVVAKKVAKRANRRNYMKRVLREWFRTHRHQLPPVDLIIRVQQPFDSGQRAEVLMTLHKLMTGFMQDTTHTIK
ncbi:ribonuclease P protein component [Neisseriaceae bacterium ESL0693]|nr:ribonuclease P protein component [Neisseriaceae bacterium ESL0693]